MAEKSDGKSVGKPWQFKPGQDERRGKGPAKGAPNAGRPPNWLREYCDSLLANPKCQKQVESVLFDNSHSAFATMWKGVADRAAGRPKETKELNGEFKATVVFRNE